MDELEALPLIKQSWLQIGLSTRAIALPPRQPLFLKLFVNSENGRMKLDVRPKEITMHRAFPIRSHSAAQSSWEDST